MAESTLSLQYTDIQDEVGRFLGWAANTTQWTAQQNTDFSFILKRGQRQFFYPSINEGVPDHEWSFLRVAGSITLSSGDRDYDLPDNFATILDDSTRYASGTGHRPLLKVSESTIDRELAEDATKGIPRYFAVRVKAHAPTTGHRSEMIVYPTPGATAALGNSLAISYRYVKIPDAITTTNKYIEGGGRYSELFLSSCLAAAAERLDDDAANQYQERFKQQLISAIRADLDFKENERGGKA